MQPVGQGGEAVELVDGFGEAVKERVVWSPCWVRVFGRSGRGAVEELGFELGGSPVGEAQVGAGGL